jgi:hypothetical protein
VQILVKLSSTRRPNAARSCCDPVTAIPQSAVQLLDLDVLVRVIIRQRNFDESCLDEACSKPGKSYVHEQRLRMQGSGRQRRQC